MCACVRLCGVCQTNRIKSFGSFVVDWLENPCFVQTQESKNQSVHQNLGKFVVAQQNKNRLSLNCLFWKGVPNTGMSGRMSGDKWVM